MLWNDSTAATSVQSSLLMLKKQDVEDVKQICSKSSWQRDWERKTEDASVLQTCLVTCDCEPLGRCEHEQMDCTITVLLLMFNSQWKWNEKKMIYV